MANSWKGGSTRYYRRQRAFTLQRDNGICHLCGWPDADTADHLVPKSEGGSDHHSNLKAAHWECNLARGDGPIVAMAPPKRVRTNHKLAQAQQELETQRSGNRNTVSPTKSQPKEVSSAQPGQVPPIARETRRGADESRNSGVESGQVPPIARETRRGADESRNSGVESGQVPENARNPGIPRLA